MPGIDDEDETIGGSTRKPLGRHEFPDEALDEANDESEDDGTDPCPHCGADIYADGDWCPKCGKFLSKEDEPAPSGSWTTTAIIVVVLAVMLLTALLGR